MSILGVLGVCRHEPPSSAGTCSRISGSRLLTAELSFYNTTERIRLWKELRMQFSHIYIHHVAPHPRGLQRRRRAPAPCASGTSRRPSSADHTPASQLPTRTPDRAHSPGPETSKLLVQHAEELCRRVSRFSLGLLPGARTYTLLVRTHDGDADARYGAPAAAACTAARRINTAGAMIRTSRRGTPFQFLRGGWQID